MAPREQELGRLARAGRRGRGRARLRRPALGDRHLDRPGALVSHIGELMVFGADVTGTTKDLVDGEINTQTNPTTDPTRWRLSLTANGSSDLDVALVVAHELGHLMSLNSEQLTGQSAQVCQTLYVGEGCLRDDAHLLTFLDETWPDDEWSELGAALDITDPAKQDQALDDFYAQHASSFVDSYAETDPTEDFAESFGVWCAFGSSSPVLHLIIEGT